MRQPLNSSNKGNLDLRSSAAALLSPVALPACLFQRVYTTKVNNEGRSVSTQRRSSCDAQIRTAARSASNTLTAVVTRRHRAVQARGRWLAQLICQRRLQCIAAGIGEAHCCQICTQPSVHIILCLVHWSPCACATTWPGAAPQLTHCWCLPRKSGEQKCLLEQLKKTLNQLV